MRRTLGTILVIGLVLALAGCMPGGPGKMTIKAQLADTAGLFVGNDVGVLGVSVGKITSIEPKGSYVEVTMEVDDDQPIPKDAGAVVVARSVATDRYVELTPVYSSGPRMTDGTVIDQPRTRTPVDFDTVLSSLNTLATGLGGNGPTANAVGDVINEGAATLQGKGRLFNEAVTSLGEAVNGVSGQRGDIVGTLRSLDTLTQTLATNQQTVRTFTDEVTSASEMLAAERNNFRNALRGLSSAVRVVAKFAKDNRQEMTTSLNQASRLARSLLEDRASLEEILRVMPLGLQNLRRTYADGYIRVALDPTLLTPLGGVVETVCTTLPIPAGTCQLIGPELLDLEGALGGILGGGLLGGRS